jgi:hypothetical protein
LESEIETLKQDIQIRDQTIKVWDMDLAQARKLADTSHAQAFESEKTFDRVLSNLTEANEARTALSTRWQRWSGRRTRWWPTSNLCLRNRKKFRLGVRSFGRKVITISPSPVFLRSNSLWSLGSEALVGAEDPTGVSRA